MRHLAFTALLLLAGCEKNYQSELLGLTYRPPAGFEAEAQEEPGPPKMANLGRGLRFYSLDMQLGDIEKLPLEPIASSIRHAAKLPEAEVTSSRTGSLPTGQVVRYEFKAPSGDRELMYAVLAGNRLVLVDLTAPEAQFGPLEAKVEGSLSSLRIKR
jgi:hypothetical protein